MICDNDDAAAVTSVVAGAADAADTPASGVGMRWDRQTRTRYNFIFNANNYKYI